VQPNERLALNLDGHPRNDIVLLVGRTSPRRSIVSAPCGIAHKVAREHSTEERDVRKRGDLFKLKRKGLRLKPFIGIPYIGNPFDEGPSCFAEAQSEGAQKLTEKQGRRTNVISAFPLICLPPNTGLSWVSTLQLNVSLSYKSNQDCQAIQSTQMHRRCLFQAQCLGDILPTVVSVAQSASSALAWPVASPAASMPNRSLLRAAMHPRLQKNREPWSTRNQILPSCAFFVSTVRTQHPVHPSSVVKRRENGGRVRRAGGAFGRTAQCGRPFGPASHRYRETTGVATQATAGCGVRHPGRGPHRGRVVRQGRRRKIHDCRQVVGGRRTDWPSGCQTCSPVRMQHRET
jgi:hypothetical protein